MPIREHLIIDGYNVIHKNKELKEVIIKYGWSAASDRLINLCLSVLTRERYITIVFDGNGERNDVQRIKNINNFRVIFSSQNYSADAVIEKIILNTKKPTLCTVVTDDTGIINSVVSNNSNAVKADSFFKNISDYSEAIARYDYRKAKNWKLNTSFDAL